MNPPFGKRKWIKLWTTEWLDGTTRYQMSGAQRAFWVDLLAMAGASRFPGIICAGKDGDSFVGYPLARFQALVSDPMDVAATLELFERTGKIKIDVTSVGPPKAVKIEIVNWDKYQDRLLSGAERTKRWRDKKKGGDAHRDARGDANATRGVTRVTRVDVEVDGDGDGDGEVDGEEAAERASPVKNKKAPKAAAENLTAAAALSAIGFDKPVGDHNFRTLLVRKYKQRISRRETRTDFLEAVLQECQASGIGVPPQVYAMKRHIEEEDLTETQSAEDDGRLRRGRT